MERKVSSLPPGRHGAGSSLGSRCGKWSSKLFSLSSRWAESVSREADPCPASQQELKVSTSGLCVCRCVMKTVTLHIYARPLSPGPVTLHVTLSMRRPDGAYPLNVSEHGKGDHAKRSPSLASPFHLSPTETRTCAHSGFTPFGHWSAALNRKNLRTVLLPHRIGEEF